MLRILLPLLLASGMAVAAAQTTVPTSAPAAAAADPYSATVPVAGTTDAQRSAAIAAALTQVLQQVSPGFVASPDLLANASGYVRNYQYSRAASGAGLALKVDFDPGAIGQLVAQGGGGAATAAAPAAGSAASPAGASPAPAGTAATAAASGTATLWVDGIDSTHAYASLLALLRGDSQLHDVVPVAAQDDGVLLQVGFSAPLVTVVAALETPNGQITQAAQPHPGADASLHWTP